MHVLGIKREIAEEHSWVAINVFRAFNEAKSLAMKRMANPRIVPLAFYREAWEEQEELMGPDPWEYGLTDANRHTLETISTYAHEQGLTRRKLTPGFEPPAIEDGAQPDGYPQNVAKRLSSICG